MKLRLFCTLALLCVLATPCSVAVACDLCAIYSASRASGADARGFSVGMAEQFTSYGTLKNDGKTVANPLGQRMDSSITQIFGSYTFNNRFGVQLTLPIIDRSFKRSDGTGGVQTGNVFGIGDITLIGSFMPYQKFTEDFSFTSRLLAGIKLPSGSTSRLKEELMEVPEVEGIPESGVHGHDLTLGSGSVDGIIGTALSTRWRRFLAAADIQYAIRSRGTIHYRFANDLHWSFSPGGYALMNHKETLAIALKVSGERKSLDNLAGAPADDTGINAVFLGPDFLFTWKDKLSVNLGADIPVMIHNTALQSVPDFRIRTAITWNL